MGLPTLLYDKKVAKDEDSSDAMQVRRARERQVSDKPGSRTIELWDSD